MPPALDFGAAGPSSSLATIPSSPLPLLEVTAVSPLSSSIFFNETQPSFAITPPSATLPSSRSWPLPPLSSLYSRPDISSSAPDLAAFSASAEPSTVASRATSDDASVSHLYSSKHASETSLVAPGREDKRYHALLELVETERGYLDSLRVLVKGYFQTLPFLDVLTAADIASVVRNAEKLLELHERIAVRLVQVEQELGWMSADADVAQSDAKVRGAAGRVARVFLDELPNFGLYDEFCSQHGEALDIVRSVESRPEWEIYERQCAHAAAIQAKESSAASTSGENTPLAQPPSSPFFPTIITTRPSSETPPPSTPIPEPSASQPSVSSHHVQHHKLRFADYAIKPVQRICRYPLVLGAVLKNLGECPERAQFKKAWEGMRKVVEGVDEAKREREGELRTRIVAARMEFQAPIGWAFCDVLGPTLLIGTLHVLHRSPTAEAFRNKYYGCFLYRSHLVMVKIRKRDSYEPRDWLPLRQFSIEGIEEGEGFLPLSIRLSYQDHHFELGATCAAEKTVWLTRLQAAQREAQRQWDGQPLDEEGQPTLFDDTLVSSVYSGSEPVPTGTPAARRPHVRSTSAVSDRSYSQKSLASVPDRRHSYFDFKGEYPPVPSSPIDGSSTLASAPPPSYSTQNRNRFSTTASSLLGRTPSAQRQAIDLRLADVFSEECLAARAQAARGGSAAGAVRRRAMSSGPPKTNVLPGAGRMTAKERRRMSCIDVGAKKTLEQALDPDYRGAVGFDASLAQVYAEATTEKRWSTALKRTKSGITRSRPTLPDIDTDLAEAGKKGVAAGSSGWKSRAMSLRRAASQSSLTDARGRSPVHSIVFSTSPTATDVERNNSVSSNASSSGTHSTTYSSRTAFETPLSSLPPSPELGKSDFEHFSTTPAPTLRFPAGQSLSDSVTNAFKLKRRGSQLALPELEHSHSEPVGGSGRGGLSRRFSFLSKRVQSSPSLTSFFGVSNSTPPDQSPRPLSSISTPYLNASGSETETPTWSSPTSSAPSSPTIASVDLSSPIDSSPPTPYARLTPVPDVATRRSKALSMRFKFSTSMSPVS
ncbi:hypothetical protein RQP46_008349 [Phenoliferia psychrophenolica]